MKQIITTLTVYIFLLIFSTNQTFAVSLFEEQILNFGKSYEDKGQYKKALGIYQHYQKSNDFSQAVADRIKSVKPKIKKRIVPKKIIKKRKPTSSSIYTIQLLTTNLQYQKSAKRHQRKIERKYGFDCYLKEGKYLYLRCQDSSNRRDLDDDISLLDENNEDFFVVKVKKDLPPPPPPEPTPEEPPVEEDKPLSSAEVEVAYLQQQLKFLRQQAKNEKEKALNKEKEKKKIVKTISVPKVLLKPNKDTPKLKKDIKEIKKPVSKKKEKPKLLVNPNKDKKKVVKKKPKNKLLENPSKKKRALHKKPVNKKTSSQYTLSQGYKALNSKKNELAKKIFADILHYSPKNIDAAFGYALAFMNDGNWVKAFITLNKVIKLTDREDIQKTFKGIKYNMYLKKGWKNVATNPGKSVEFFKKAQEVENTSDISEGLAYAYSNNKELDKAIPEMEKLFKAKKNVKNANMLIKTYLKEKQVKKARIFFDSLDPIFQANMTYNPKRAELLAEVKSLFDNKQYRQAKNLLRELYLMYPTNLTVLLYFAKVYEAEKQFKNSLEYYRTVLAKEPANKEALMGLGRIFISKKEYSKALDILLRLDSTNDKEVQSIIKETKLQLYLTTNRYKEAFSLGKEMLMEDPTDVKLYVILGDINVKMQRQREAYFYYGRAFQIDSTNFDIRMKLLNLLLEQKLFDQTQTLLGKFKGFQLEPAQQQILRDFYISFYKKYTSVSLEEKDYIYALKGAKSGLQMEPEDTFFIESAGWAALNSKRYSDAIYYFSKILAKTPQNYTIHYGVGLAYVNLKQMNNAKKSFKTAEASSDADLLYKVAEIYKDTGFKKDAYRVIKLIEELGRRSISQPNNIQTQEQTTSVTRPPTSAKTDDMNTYNPFLSNFSNQKPPPVQNQIIQPQITQPKKKNGNQWFF